jgi:hypothetical protein
LDFGSTVVAAAPKPPTLVVPTQLPSIQAAVDAASPGAMIQILGGTYTESYASAKE